MAASTLAVTSCFTNTLFITLLTPSTSCTRVRSAFQSARIKALNTVWRAQTAAVSGWPYLLPPASWSHSVFPRLYLACPSAFTPRLLLPLNHGISLHMRLPGYSLLKSETTRANLESAKFETNVTSRAKSHFPFSVHITSEFISLYLLRGVTRTAGHIASHVRFVFHFLFFKLLLSIWYLMRGLLPLQKYVQCFFCLVPQLDLRN